MTSFGVRSEEHTSELQSPYVISYAVFCLKKNHRHGGRHAGRPARPAVAGTPRAAPLAATGGRATRSAAHAPAADAAGLGRGYFLMIRRPPRSTLFPYTTLLPISVRAVASAIANGTLSMRASVWARCVLRSEEHTSELQSPYVISYAVFCLKK